jgi:hypothetical protein
MYGQQYIILVYCDTRSSERTKQVKNFNSLEGSGGRTQISLNQIIGYSIRHIVGRVAQSV